MPTAVGASYLIVIFTNWGMAERDGAYVRDFNMLVA